MKKELGVIVAPPGSGKTIVALKIVADKQQPTLIVVHRKQLAQQWAERISTFLGIPKQEIGHIGQGKNKIGSKITIATIQSLNKAITDDNNLTKAFGTIIIDECHHVPAETFRETIAKFYTFYLYGLTATPFRKYNEGKLIFIHLGEVIAEIKSTDIGSFKQTKVLVRQTSLDVPFNAKTDQFETLSKILVHDSARNKLILTDIINELKVGKKAVIITERKEHIDTLNQYLKQSFETITLSGEDSERSRIQKWKYLNEGNYQVLITTGQFFGEGSDLQNANCLFLVYPFSFEGKLIQYIGRVQRSELTPIIYDYHDVKIDYLHKLFLKRNTYYRKIEKQATLFDDPDENQSIVDDKVIRIEKTIKIAIENIDFKYGAITFKYKIDKPNTILEFEIENLNMRPEFDVLKPYFAKALKSQYINIDILVEFENEQLVSQLATSEDLQKINREVIEGVKFKFVEKKFLGKIPQSKENILTIDEIQSMESSNSSLYNDGNTLLDDILNQKQFKHSRQLRYLADQHDSSVLKIRFVLSPFAFVFLLTGNEYYHIILETLDTEEATYHWQIEKNKTTLRNQLKEIDEQLTIIRNQGRQSFLETKPLNFSRILHDYSDIQKGFIIWKDLLEEKLV